MQREIAILLVLTMRSLGRSLRRAQQLKRWADAKYDRCENCHPVFPNGRSSRFESRSTPRCGCKLTPALRGPLHRLPAKRVLRGTMIEYSQIGKALHA
jgi:hypothetical protein